MRRTIVVVDQNVVAAPGAAHRVNVLNNAHIVYKGRADELEADRAAMNTRLGM